MRFGNIKKYGVLYDGLSFKNRSKFYYKKSILWYPVECCHVWTTPFMQGIILLGTISIHASISS